VEVVEGVLEELATGRVGTRGRLIFSENIEML
jgi:hypothetical protein